MCGDCVLGGMPVRVIPPAASLNELKFAVTSAVNLKTAVSFSLEERSNWYCST
jgi:hypothetical protein